MNMIDKNEFLKFLNIFSDRENGNEHFLNGIDTAREIIESMPTIDAIPIEEDTHGFHCFEDMCDMPDDKCEVCKRSYEHGFAAGKAQARLEKIFEFQKTHARVVRCRDCIHSVFVDEANDYLCRYMSVDQSDPDFRIGGNWFCADGERRGKK